MSSNTGHAKNGTKSSSTNQHTTHCDTGHGDAKGSLVETAHADADDASDGDEWTQLTQPLSVDEQMALLRAELQQLRQEVNALARSQTKTDSALAKLKRSTEKLKDKIKTKKS